LKPKGNGEMSSGTTVLASFDLQFGKVYLGLLGGLGWQFAEAAQDRKDAQRVSTLAHLLIATTQGEQTIDEVQRRFHESCLHAARGDPTILASRYHNIRRFGGKTRMQEQRKLRRARFQSSLHYPRSTRVDIVKKPFSERSECKQTASRTFSSLLDNFKR
jgi:hypothetical protein